MPAMELIWTEILITNGWVSKYFKITIHDHVSWLDYFYKVAGASANPCSEVFSGPYPASEPEVKSLMRYIMNKSPRWVSHISLHSYGAIWLSPFSYSKTHIQENFEETVKKILNSYQNYTFLSLILQYLSAKKLL